MVADGVGGGAEAGGVTALVPTFRVGTKNCLEEFLEMPATIEPTVVRYIKLGEHGKWEPECIQEGTIRLGFGTEDRAAFRLCQRSAWDKLKRLFLEEGNSAGVAERFKNEIQIYFEDDGSTLWITFSSGQFYWGFIDPCTLAAKHTDGDGVWRVISGGWKSANVVGAPIRHLPWKVTKLAGYNGTSCSVDAADYVVKRINSTSQRKDRGTSVATPEAPDLAEPPARVLSTTYRILRDTALALRVKALHKNECQLCGHTIILPDGSRYSEGHHIQPLGKPHDGPDVMANIICVCPNHHAELDYGVRALLAKDLRTVPGHSVSETYIHYHNSIIYGRNTPRCGTVS